MNRLIAVLLLICVTFSASVPATSAEDGVDRAIKAIALSPVYVSPSVQSLDRGQRDQLAGSLRDDDHIVFVMLTTADTGTQDADQVALRIDTATNSEYIIGLSLDGEVVGYSNRIPESVTADLMKRANSVATSPTEALTIFAKLVHKYQAANPEPAPTPIPVTPSQPSDTTSTGWVWVVVVLVVSGGIAWIVWTRRSKEVQDDQTLSLSYSPKEVQQQLQALAGQRSLITDSTMSTAITRVISDTEAFFKRSTKSRSSGDAGRFVEQLQIVNTMLLTYVDIQENPRFYDHPDRLLIKGREAVEGFAEYVINAIKAGNAKFLADYQMDAQLLDAQRQY